MAKHYHRIVLCVDIETDERLSATRETVQESAFSAIREQYDLSNVTLRVLDADCLAGQSKELPTDDYLNF